MTTACHVSSGVRLLSRRSTSPSYRRPVQPCYKVLLAAVPLLSSTRSGSECLPVSRSYSTTSPSHLARWPGSLRAHHRHPRYTAEAINSTTSLPSSDAPLLVARRHANIHVTNTTADEFSSQFELLSDTIQHAVDQPDVEAGDVDLSYSNGVLSLRTRQHGTYVINQHGVTRQVWLSSPISGPSKYNWHREREAVARDGRRRQGQWCNERDVSKDLMGLLEREFSQVFDSEVKFDEPF